MRLPGDLAERTLWGALVVGLALRLWGLDFGLPHTSVRPDESILVHRALAVAGGQWNPGFFNYPSFHIYLLSLAFGAFYVVSLLLGSTSGTQDFLLAFLLDSSHIYLVGRGVTVLMGTATIAAAWHLAKSVGGRSAGAPAAILLAAAMLHVRDSHFLTVDVPVTCWTTAALVALVQHARSGDRRALVFGSILLGLAISTKYNAALLVPALLVAVFKAPGQNRHNNALLASGVLALAFFGGSPFIALDPLAFWRDFVFEWQHFGRGHAGQDPGNGWIYHLTFTLRHGLGLPALLAALAGLAWMGYRRSAADLVVLTAVAAYFAVAGGGNSLFVRYALPLLPLLCVAAAVGIGHLLRQRPARAAVLAAVLAAPSMLASVQQVRMMALDDTRELARRWIESHVDSGARIGMTGSDYGHPRLHPTSECLQRRLEEARQHHQAGRRLQLALNLSGYPPDPAYDLVELRQQVVPGDLQRTGIDWLIVQRHPLPYAQVPTGLESDLAGRSPAVVFEPAGLQMPLSAFDRLDAWYLPYAGHVGMTRPGPELRIYRLGPP